MGRLHRPHGLGGDVVMSLITNRAERAAPGAVLFLGDRALRIESVRSHGDRFLVRFEGVHGREAADALRGVVTADPLEDADELWVHDLIGTRVVDHDGHDRGVVAEVQENPASDLLVLEDGTMVPMVFVTEVDAGVVHVEAPRGLFEPG